MKDMLQKLGVTELFSDDACDLKGVSPDELYVGDVESVRVQCASARHGGLRFHRCGIAKFL
ncbi:hypothetical protein OSTOST_23819 [Ostertagia ostertagi]